MFLVTIEDKEDGTWWDDPHGFDTMQDAKRYADECQPPEGYEAAIWVCRRADLPAVK